MFNTNLGDGDITLIEDALNEKKATNDYLMSEKEFFEGSLDLVIKEIENVRIDSLLTHLKGLRNDKNRIDIL